MGAAKQRVKGSNSIALQSVGKENFLYSYIFFIYTATTEDRDRKCCIKMMISCKGNSAWF